MTLPLPLKMPVGDTPLSFASALAYSNGFSSLRQFLRAADIKPVALAQGEKDATAKLSYWSGEASSAISRFTVPPVGRGASWKLGEARFNNYARKGSNYRFCPRCIVHDLECMDIGATAMPFVRASWLTRAVKNCVTHKIALSELPVRDGSYEDFVRLALEHRSAIEELARTAEAVSSCELDRYVEACVMGKSTGNYLDGFETYVAVDLCKYLGHFLNRHGYKSTLLEKAYSNSTARELGYALASQGESAIRVAVSQVITTTARECSTQFQFGSLGLWLDRNLKNPAFAGVTDLFQDIAERALPVGPGDTCFRPVGQRHLHSINTAAAEYGLPDKRVYRLVRDAGLIEGSDRPFHMISFSAADAHQILIDASDTLTSHDARKLLGLQENIFAKLLDDGLIPRVECDTTRRIYSRIRRSDLRAFTEAVFANSRRKLPTAGHLPLGKACQKIGCSQSTLLSKIVSGAIKDTAAHQDHADKVSKIWVNVDEARKVLSTWPESAHGKCSDAVAERRTLRQAARALRTTNISVSALATQGFLTLQVDRIGPSNRKRTCVTEASLSSFAIKHISIADLARDHDTHPVIVRRCLENWGVNPVNDSPGRVARFFLRSDVEHLNFPTPNRPPS